MSIICKHCNTSMSKWQLVDNNHSCISCFEPLDWDEDGGEDWDDYEDDVEFWESTGNGGEEEEEGDQQT
jgi:hypothetical protein